MSVFDLIDHCLALFEELTTLVHTEKGLRLYVRAFLIFNYFVNTFIMVHFNGFSSFVESNHQDFIIYLNLYNFFRSDEIIGASAFDILLPKLRQYMLDYLVEKKLLTFDVQLLFRWLNDYIEYLKHKDELELEEEELEPSEPDSPYFYKSNHSKLLSLSELLQDDLNFNQKFPEISVPQHAQYPAEKPAKSPYPVEKPAENSPYPVEKPAESPYPVEKQAEKSPYPVERSNPPSIPVPPRPVSIPQKSHNGFAERPPPVSTLLSGRISVRHNSQISLDGTTPPKQEPPKSFTTGNFSRPYHPLPPQHQIQPPQHQIQPPFQQQMPPLQHQPYPHYLSPPQPQYQQFQVPLQPQQPASLQQLQYHKLFQPQLQYQPAPLHQQQKRNWLATHAICGLKNLGSSCYINLTLQTLFGVARFISLFSRKSNSTQLAKAMSLAEGPTTLTEAMVGLLATFEASGGATVAPTKFLRILLSMKLDFNIPFEQQDAQEFLLFVLDKLHEELAHKSDPEAENTDFVKKWGIDVNPADKEEYLAWYRSLIQAEGQLPVSDIFQGHIQSRLICNKCGHKSNSYTPFLILSLPIPQTAGPYVELTECLRYYTQDEVLLGENAWNCPKCYKPGENAMDVVFSQKKLYRPWRSKSPKKTVPEPQSAITLKQLNIVKLPAVLFIHLSRFLMLSSVDKLNTNILYPLRLKFNYMSHDVYYNLTGVVNHYGTLKSGHYTSLVNKARPSPGKDVLAEAEWCYFDDDNYRTHVPHGNVQQDNANKIQSRDVYVLCYERI